VTTPRRRSLSRPNPTRPGHGRGLTVPSRTTPLVTARRHARSIAVVHLSGGTPARTCGGRVDPRARERLIIALSDLPSDDGITVPDGRRGGRSRRDERLRGGIPRRVPPAGRGSRRRQPGQVGQRRRHHQPHQLRRGPPRLGGPRRVYVLDRSGSRRLVHHGVVQRRGRDAPGRHRRRELEPLQDGVGGGCRYQLPGAREHRNRRDHRQRLTGPGPTRGDRRRP